MVPIKSYRSVPTAGTSFDENVSDHRPRLKTLILIMLFISEKKKNKKIHRNKIVMIRMNCLIVNVSAITFNRICSNAAMM